MGRSAAPLAFGVRAGWECLSLDLRWVAWLIYIYDIFQEWNIFRCSGVIGEFSKFNRTKSSPLYDLFGGMGHI